MKVLILHSELGILRGGGENFTRNLFTAFAKRGHRIAAAFVADRIGKYLIPLPQSIEPVPLRGWWSRKFGQATLTTIGRFLSDEGLLRKKWHFFQEAISWRTIRWHNRRFQQRVEQEFRNRWTDFDVVYVHGDAVLASRVAGYCPTVLRLPGPVAKEMEPMLRTVHAVCANGDALLRIRAFLGKHATELPTGIDSDVFKPRPSLVRSNLKWTDKHQVVGYVGRLTHLKGVDLLTAALRKALTTNPDIRLLIVGTGEEEKNIRSELSKELASGIAHIESDVDHEGLADWYRAMDLLVMPSRYENFSNALLEGMACGIPFLAGDVGGNRIMAKMGGGWLFEAGSVSCLSACLNRILRSGPELKLRGTVAFNYVQNHHSWSVTAKHLEEIIEARLGIR